MSMASPEADHWQSAAASLSEQMAALRAQEEQLSWRGTFLDYFELVCKNPNLARLSHGRIYDMIMSHGVKEDERHGKEYLFFSKHLFGLRDTINHLMEYFSSAAKRLEVRKRILLLMGPVGGGKSTLVTLLKRGLEEYTRTDDGAIYAIDGCPMNEEPLHLIPHRLRPEIEEKYGIYIEGDLCPACNLRLREEFNGVIENVPVRRIVFSEKDRRGIGTFSPSDEKSQDISELVGSIDLATVGRYGSESDPRAYRFDGELNVANRGLMEFVEMLKASDEFLYSLLTLSQEQAIKTSRFSMIYADEVVVSHTNEAEYNAFIQNQRNEALRDRIILIKVPYNLRVDDEVKIYEKLLNESGIGKDVHIAPYTLQVASTFAILTRLEDSKKAGMSRMKKLRLYNEESVEGFTQADVAELKAECEREGMEGISPRYVINRLSSALAGEDITCLNPIDALRSLRDGLEQMTGISREKREEYLNYIYETRKMYDETAKNEIHKAFVYSFEESARTLFNNYIDNVEAYCTKQKLKDPITGEELDPDEKLMRSIEEQIGVTENAKRAFREEIMIRISALARRGKKLDYTAHDRLREAIEKQLFADLRNIVKITTSAKTPDAEQLRRINEVVDRLIAEHGYCSHCANELVQYVGQLLNR